jgi:hypothetical protein
MTEEILFLRASTRAIASSRDAIHLIEQKERVEHALMKEDSPLILDTSKAFLESILKTILSDLGHEIDANAKLMNLYKELRGKVKLSNDSRICEILERLASSVVHNVAELRNKFGAASHGDDGYYENPVQVLEAEMIAQFVDSLSAFLYTKHKEATDPAIAARIYYNDYPEFNDWLDFQYEGFHLELSTQHQFSLTFSQLLFQNDQPLYREMLLQYRNSEQEDFEDE